MFLLAYFIEQEEERGIAQTASHKPHRYRFRQGTLRRHHHDCVRCAYHEVVGFESFGDRELVFDLPKRRNWRCPRCGCREIESRPKFVSREEPRDWAGLQNHF